MTSGAPSTGVVTVQAVAVCPAVCLGPETLTVNLPNRKALQPSSTHGVAGSETLDVPVPGGSPNGVYTATLAGGRGADVSTSFALDIPPTEPSGVAATSPSAGVVTVTWGASQPADVDGYQIDEGAARAAAVRPTACSSGTCSATFAAAAGAHRYAVRATRPSGVGTVQTMSAPSAVAAVQVAARPGGTTASPGGGSAGAPPGTAAQGQPQARASAARAFAPPAGIATLPALPGLGGSGAVPNGEPTAPGTYGRTLTYPDLTVPGKPSSVPVAVADHVRDAVSDRTVVASIAAGLLVLLVAAHLRVLIRRPDLADL